MQVACRSLASRGPKLEFLASDCRSTVKKSVVYPLGAAAARLMPEDRALRVLHDLLWHLGGKVAAALAPEWLAAIDEARVTPTRDAYLAVETDTTTGAACGSAR